MAYKNEATKLLLQVLEEVVSSVLYAKGQMYWENAVELHAHIFPRKCDYFIKYTSNFPQRIEVYSA